MKLFFLLLVCSLALVSPVRGVPPARNLLQATLDVFRNAIAAGDKAMIFRVFNWPNHNEERVNALIARTRGTGYIVSSAVYLNDRQIEGIVAVAVTTPRGTTSSTKKIMIRYDAGSPTNWKIFLVAPYNAGK